MADQPSQSSTEANQADTAAPEGVVDSKKPSPEQPSPEQPSPEQPSPEPEAKSAATPEAKASAPATAPEATSVETPVETPVSSGRKRGPYGQSPKPGKKMRNHRKSVYNTLRKETPMPLEQAIPRLKELRASRMKLRKKGGFNETVELHVWLGIDTTHSDQMVRGSVSLPHGIGKSVRVLVFCQGDNIEKAKAAGADFAGSDELIKKIQGENWLDFDVTLATQDMMGQVSRLGKLLGPRGLMPTPKGGTVIPASGDVAQTVQEFKAGKVEFRADKGGNVHAGVGKMSFEDQQLFENIKAFVDQIKAIKPSGVRGNYVLGISISATMSPGIRVTMPAA